MTACWPSGRIKNPSQTVTAATNTTAIRKTASIITFCLLVFTLDSIRCQTKNNRSYCRVRNYRPLAAFSRCFISTTHAEGWYRCFNSFLRSIFFIGFPIYGIIGKKLANSGERYDTLKFRTKFLPILKLESNTNTIRLKYRFQIDLARNIKGCNEM